MRIPFTGFALALAVWALPASAGEVHPDDVALIQVVAKAAGAGSVAEIRRAVGHDAEAHRDAGFGGTWMRFRVGGESVTCWIDVVTHRDQLAGIRLRSLGGSDAWKQAARQALGAKTVVARDGIELRVVRAPVLAAYKKEVRAGFEQPPATPWGTPPEIATLTDPWADLTFGASCYEDGGPPAGRKEADALRLAGRVNALDAVLRGPNPEGRLYAAQALLTLASEGAPVPSGLHTAIHIVRNLPVRIRSCSGCCVEHRTAGELFGDETFLPRAAFHIVERREVDGTWVDDRRILVYYDGTYVVRHRLVAPPRAGERMLVRGKLSAAVAQHVWRLAHKTPERTIKIGAPIFVVELGDTKTTLPEAIARIRDEVPQER